MLNQQAGVFTKRVEEETHTNWNREVTSEKEGNNSENKYLFTPQTCMSPP